MRFTYTTRIEKLQELEKSRSTWQSSLASDHDIAGSSLSTVLGDSLSSRFSGKPESTVSSVNTMQGDESTSKLTPSDTIPRPPRLPLGQKAKQPRIETSTMQPGSRKRTFTFHHSPSVLMTDKEQRSRIFDSDVLISAPLERSISDPEHEQVLRSPPSIDLALHVPSDISVSRAGSVQVNNSMDHAGELRPMKSNPFRSNKSSISLKDD